MLVQRLLGSAALLWAASAYCSQLSAIDDDNNNDNSDSNSNNRNAQLSK